MENKIQIHAGHTNKKKYRQGNTFILYMDKNGFNHHIDYKLLSKFDFVPKLISSDNEKLVWEWIDGEHLDKPTDADIIQLASILRELHKSETIFPKNNMKKRVMSYLKIVHEKGLHIPEIENNFRPMIKVLSRMNRINAVHNDIWPENIIKDKNGKLWVVDWEYATMGDKHFDISYISQSFFFSKEQKELFLRTYNSFDDYNAYISTLLPNYEKLVNWVTLCWAYAQDKVPFPLEGIKKALK